MKTRACNLCRAPLAPANPFERFCACCREGNEFLRFGDWLPELDDALAAKAAA